MMIIEDPFCNICLCGFELLDCREDIERDLVFGGGGDKLLTVILRPIVFFVQFGLSFLLLSIVLFIEFESVLLCLFLLLP